MKKFLLLLMLNSSLYASPQAVVFDFDGVMTGASKSEIITDFLKRSLQLSDHEYASANQEKRGAILTGMTDEEFWTAFAEKNGVPLAENWHTVFKLMMKEALGVNRDMYKTAKELKQRGVRVVLLANLDPRLAKLIKDLQLHEIFDACLLSSEIGVQKPDAGAYQLLLERLQVPAKDVVFVDDDRQHTAVAKKMGFDAITFTSHDQLRTELQNRNLVQK